MEYSDNDLFLDLIQAKASAKNARLKGYYICSLLDRGCGADFIKAVAKPTAICPFCGGKARRVKIMNDVDVRLQMSLWRNSDTYTDLKADLIGKEAACL